MLGKVWNSETQRYDVTFDLPAEVESEQAHVVGDFNDWDESADAMQRQADGRWAATLALEPDRSYRFRYHLGGDRWENDWSADRYESNDFGGSDSVVEVPPAPTPPPPVKEGAATAKKAAGKKATAKKAAGKKATGKKAAGKKATAKKAVAKKASPKRAGS